MILLDTNVLARMTDSAHPLFQTARQTVQSLLSRRERLVIVPQNLYEFWAVARRFPGVAPIGQHGLGMSCEQASQWIKFFQRKFIVMADNERLPDI
jgi:hypothetical protein